VSVGETQQQGNIIHTTTTVSQARCCLAATSSGELVFFVGGNNSTGQPSDRVDIYNVTSGNWKQPLSLFLVLDLQPFPHKILSSLVEVGMK
jgi:hypothetical protein